MARIIFNPDSPIQRLSGRYGDYIYVYKYGKQFLHGAPKPTLPLHPTPEQRRSFQRQTIIDQCVNIIQSQLELSQEAIDARKTIANRIRYLYDVFSPTIQAPTKLQKMIMTDYYRNHPLTDLGLPLKSFQPR